MNTENELSKKQMKEKMEKIKLLKEKMRVKKI